MEKEKEIVRENKNSIEVKKDAKGNYSWGIKIYFCEDNIQSAFFTLLDYKFIIEMK